MRADNHAAKPASKRRRPDDHLDDEVHARVEDWSQLRRLTRYLRPYRTRIVVAVVASIVVSILMLLPAIVVKYLIDDKVMTGDLSGLWWLVGGLGVVVLVTLVIEAWSTMEIARIGQLAMRDLRVSLLDHLQRQALAFYDRRPVGWLVTRMTSDVNTLNDLFSQGIVGIFQQMFMLVGIIVVLFWFNWQLALWSMILLPLVFFASRWFRDRLRVSYRLTRARLSRLNTHVQENVSGMRIVQANTRQQRQFELFDELNAAHRDAVNKTTFAFATFFPAIELLASLGLAIVLWQGGRQYLEGRVTLGELFLFISLLERFFAPIRDLSEKYNLIQSAIAAGERLFAILDQKPDLADPATTTAPAAGALRGRIEFRDVWFAYKEPDWVLKGVSFVVEPGQTFALVGPTGSGKTTIMSLLCRFYDVQKGAVLIDGVDVRQMPQADLRRRIAIVLQDVFLFRGTVADNIRLGNTAISDARVRAVADAVHAAPFIERLPAGYESGVMERGATLSVGQKQLLSFARALAFDPEVLILDEATSNIDSETEQLIQDALKRLCADRTALIVAHRLSTVQQAHRILVLRSGEVVETGTHRELVERDGLYRRLYELQMRD